MANAVERREQRALVRFVGTLSAFAVFVAALGPLGDGLSQTLAAATRTPTTNANHFLLTWGRVVVVAGVLAAPLALTASFVANRDGLAVGATSLLTGLVYVVAGVFTASRAGAGCGGTAADCAPAPPWAGMFVTAALLGGGLGLLFAGRHHLRRAPSILRR